MLQAGVLTVLGLRLSPILVEQLLGDAPQRFGHLAAGDRVQLPVEDPVPTDGLRQVQVPGLVIRVGLVFGTVLVDQVLPHPQRVGEVLEIIRRGVIDIVPLHLSAEGVAHRHPRRPRSLGQSLGVLATDVPLGQRLGGGGHLGQAAGQTGQLVHDRQGCPELAGQPPGGGLGPLNLPGAAPLECPHHPQLAGQQTVLLAVQPCEQVTQLAAGQRFVIQRLQRICRGTQQLDRVIPNQTAHDAFDGPADGVVGAVAAHEHAEGLEAEPGDPVAGVDGGLAEGFEEVGPCRSPTGRTRPGSRGGRSIPGCVRPAGCVRGSRPGHRQAELRAVGSALKGKPTASVPATSS
jgi:hypothetical protein